MCCLCVRVCVHVRAACSCAATSASHTAAAESVWASAESVWASDLPAWSVSSVGNVLNVHHANFACEFLI